MVLEKKIEIDQIIILLDGQIQIREVTSIVEDGVKLSHSYYRRVFIPGAVIEGNQRLKDIAAVVHTPQVIAVFQAAEKRRQAEI